LDQTFFGIDPSHKVLLHKNLFNLVWYSDGRFSWDTVYSLPIPIRNLITRLIQQQINPEAANEQIAAEQAKQTIEKLQSKYL